MSIPDKIQALVAKADRMEERPASLAGFESLLQIIYRKRSEAFQAGVTPTDVWVGPTEWEFMQEERMRLSRNQMLVADPTCKVDRWADLTVRRQMEPGVRVGVSW